MQLHVERAHPGPNTGPNDSGPPEKDRLVTPMTAMPRAGTPSHDARAGVPPDAARARLEYGDGTRVLAIAGVVAIHSLGLIPEPLRGLAATPAPWVVYVMYAATRWCVPVFLMLSGALLIEPRRPETDREFFRRRLARVIPPLAFWSVAYIAWRWFVLGTFSRPTSIGAALLRGRPEYHLWYAFALLGLYATVPLLRRFYLRATRSEQWIMGLAWIGVWTASATAWSSLGTIGWRIPPDPIVFIEWAPYMGYFVAGHLLRDVRLKGRALLACLAVATVFTLGNAAALRFLATHGRGHLAGGVLGCYLSPAAVAQSFAMFLALASLIRGRWARSAIVRRLSEATYGVYLAHAMILNLFDMSGLMAAWGPGSASIVTAWLLALATSFITVMASSRLPVVGKLTGAR